MAKILLFTTCVTNPDNSFAKREVYYTTGLLQTGISPISVENTTSISCSIYTLAAGTELERYCALATGGAGVMRVITASGTEFTNFTQTDTASTACNGTCDLNAPYVVATPTTSTTARDGKIRLDVNTSYPPVVAYNPQLGSPTRTTRYTVPGVLPATYIIEYKNVPAGIYAIQLQDNGNCQLQTSGVTVTAGAAPGTGASAVDWFKYEYIPSPEQTINGILFRAGLTFTVRGHAWNKTTKQGYAVTNQTATFPTFDENTPRYDQGDVVRYVVRTFTTVNIFYFRAKVDLVASDFVANNYKIPTPNSNSQYWEYVPIFMGSTLKYKNTFGVPTEIHYDYFASPSAIVPNPGNLLYFYYEEDTVVRYGWNNFYRAKQLLRSRDFADGRIPAPTGVTDNNWEKVNWFDDFYYAIPESQAIDQYAIGSLNRLVRYHVYYPDDAAYVPSTASSVAVAPFAALPVQGNDFILFDDTTPAVETALGDLLVVDIIKTDIDDQGEENGSVAIIATSPTPPIRFHLRNGVRAGYVQDNTTGIYENLKAGNYVVDIYDAQDRYTSVEFTISDEQRLRWRLRFDDASANPLEVRIFQRNWAGTVTDVCGAGEPVVLSWDTGGDPAGYIPEAVGANLEFNVRTSVVQQFVDTATGDDRNHRIDYYRNNILQFRGYIDATSYQEAMLGAGQTVKLTATDGLGQLKNTKFVNHLRERQTGRTSMLSIVLKCLSFTDVNLPLICGNNLRDVLMTADGEPLLEAYVNRNTYDKKDGKVIADEDIIDTRSVLDAILRVFNAMLFQADGCWKIIALNEVHDPFAVRVFSPAGARITTGVDETSTPLRILESQFATGARELFWINGTQTRTTVAAAKIVKATVALKLEENLLRNGDFTQWDGTNSRPLYWTKQGNPTITRASGEKAKEYAVQFSNYTTTLTPANYVVSSAVPHLTGQDEDGMVVKFKALLEHTTTDPNELTASLRFQVVCDGTPVGALLPVTLSTKDKWKEYTLNLPSGLPGTKVRIRMLAPVATDAASVATSLKINYVALSIQPALVDWSDQKNDFVEVLNDGSTGIQLDDIELAHADLPRLPNAVGTLLPAKKMDVYAWRHAISLADFRATTAWKRPAYTGTAPVLDNAAQERMTLRAVPTTEVTGEVKGPGISYLRTGLMLDMPEDLDGRFIVLSCFKNERAGTAQITVRKLADGDYGGVQPETPDEARIARKNGKIGYRISFVNGVEGFRTAKI